MQYKRSNSHEKGAKKYFEADRDYTQEDKT